MMMVLFPRRHKTMLFAVVPVNQLNGVRTAAGAHGRGRTTRAHPQRSAQCRAGSVVRAAVERAATKRTARAPCRDARQRSAPRVPPAAPRASRQGAHACVCVCACFLPRARACSRVRASASASAGDTRTAVDAARVHTRTQTRTHTHTLTHTLSLSLLYRMRSHIECVLILR